MSAAALAWTVYGTVVKVTDGDTVRLDLDLGWKVRLHDEPVRIAGINTPEKNTEPGIAAATALASLLPPGRAVKVISKRWLGDREKYGRVLAELELADGQHVSTWLIDRGYALPWDGVGPRPTA